MSGAGHPRRTAGSGCSSIKAWHAVDIANAADEIVAIFQDGVHNLPSPVAGFGTIWRSMVSLRISARAQRCDFGLNHPKASCLAIRLNVRSFPVVVSIS